MSAALAGLGLFAGGVFWLGTMQATLDALNPEAIQRTQVAAIKAIQGAKTDATEAIDRAKTAAVAAIESADREPSDDQVAI